MRSISLFERPASLTQQLIGPFIQTRPRDNSTANFTSFTAIFFGGNLKVLIVVAAVNEPQTGKVENNSSVH